MGWTKEQTDAINARGRSIIVSAAAGSGKTSVLVERLIRQLSDRENKIPADRMIVVTFTKDAAAEMKQRLTAALAELIEKEPENHWLNQQQLLLQSAKISTIHSFCFELIRDNIQELELSGSFRIMDETETQLIVSKAISDLVTEYYQKDIQKTEKLYEQFCYKDDNTIEDLISDIYQFISAIPYGQRWLEHVKDSYSPDGSLYDDFCSKYMQSILGQLKKAEAFSAECVGLIGDTGLDKCIDILDNEYFTITRYIEMFSSDKYSLREKAEMYNAPEFARLVMGKNADPDIKERIKILRDEYKSILKDEITAGMDLVEYSEEDFATHFEVLSILIEMISKLESNLWKIKVDKSCISFNDAEALTVKLLSSIDQDGNIVKSSLAHGLSEYYKIIMIDEFQDTNNNQDLIFKLLSHGGDATKSGENMFVVGDVKQSIYRFRLANPKNFINTMNASVQYNGDDTLDNSYIKLNKNFRSSESVISFVNFIFRSIMSREVGEIVYNSEEELVKGADFTQRDRNTEVALIVQDDNEKNSCSAKYTAKKIYDMLRNNAQVDNKDGISTRDCVKRDFCILLRRKSDADEYIQELAKCGICAYSEETAGYLKSREISVLINLLRITDNPLIDTSFAAVMLSPMFMFTDDEFAELRLINRSGHIYDAVCTGIESIEGQEPILSGDILLKTRNVYNTISELRMQSATLDLVGLIRKIYDRTDFISVIQIYSDCDKKRANLRVLLEYAKMYQEASNEGLSGFLRYIDKMVKVNGDFRQGQTVSTSEDVVMIKTIHKSKGLEFPFVFLCQTHSLFNVADSRKNIQLNFESGIGFRLQNRREFQRYPTLPFNVINKMNMSDSLSEELRLLYVALTRAKEKLFIPLKIGKSQKNKLAEYAVGIHQYSGITPRLACEAKSMSDWLLMALITHKDAKKLRELSEYDMFYTQSDNFNIKFESIEAESLSEENTISEDKNNCIEKAAVNNELVSEITEKFDFKYDYSLSILQAKVSVSEILKSDSRSDIVLKRPSFMQEGGRLTGSEKGTVIHSILQHADFQRLYSDTSAEIDNIVRHGFITEHQKYAADINLIKRFIGSELFKRALRSGNIIRERKFLMRISDIEITDEEFAKYNNTNGMIQGIIDMYFQEDDGLVLVDYKTDNVSDLSILAEKYSLQLAIYRSALRRIEEKKVKETVIYSLKLGKMINVEL